MDYLMTAAIHHQVGWVSHGGAAATDEYVLPVLLLHRLNLLWGEFLRL
jgi:hypothetical protein